MIATDIIYTPGSEPYMSRHDRDPRSDLATDHELWVALLTEARARSADLFGVLHVLRTNGAQLIRDKDLGMLIRPGQWPREEYDAFRAQALTPRKTEVVEALKAAVARLPETREAKRAAAKRRARHMVQFVEPRARGMGWTKQELWSEEPWDDPRDGRRRESLYMALATSSHDLEIGEITPMTIRLTLPDGTEWRMYKVEPAMPDLWAEVAAEVASAEVADAAAAARSQSSATSKKGKGGDPDDKPQPTLFSASSQR